MDPDQIMLGKYSLPFILSIVLNLIYKRSRIPDDLKPYIAMVIGCATGLGAMYYNEPGPIHFPLIADYVLAGGIAGTSATGIYELSKAAPGRKGYVAVDENGKRIAGARVARVSSKIKIVK